ncbi:MAG: sulfite exporter TauE/SafE family protein [Actinobacteria bacterium]|nr:MAG: sulfite exporter TauE/SafE family protein [Actinomycetota bacterium]
MTLLVVIAATVAFAATIQATMGFGFALVAVPIIAVADDPKVAVVAVTAIGVPMTLWNAIRWRAHLRVGAMVVVVGASLIGMPVGALILTRAPDRALTFAIGIAVLGLTAWLWRGLQLPAGPRTEVAAGIASGALATSTGTNGPPLVIAFQATGMERDAFRATLAGCFFVQGVIALVLILGRRAAHAPCWSCLRGRCARDRRGHARRRAALDPAARPRVPRGRAHPARALRSAGDRRRHHVVGIGTGRDR